MTEKAKMIITYHEGKKTKIGKKNQMIITCHDGKNENDNYLSWRKKNENDNYLSWRSRSSRSCLIFNWEISPSFSRMETQYSLRILLTSPRNLFLSSSRSSSSPLISDCTTFFRSSFSLEYLVIFWEKNTNDKRLEIDYKKIFKNNYSENIIWRKWLKKRRVD